MCVNLEAGMNLFKHIYRTGDGVEGLTNRTALIGTKSSNPGLFMFHTPISCLTLFLFT
jgi:hypothetical protein